MVNETNCAKLRNMNSFLAINTEQKDDKEKVYPFDLRKFLDLIESKTMVRLPRFYVGTCSVCFQQTYYQGQNRGTKLEVILT